MVRNVSNPSSGPDYLHLGAACGAWLLVCIAMSACSGALPPTTSSAALHRDLERIVTLADAEGWTIDRTQIDEALPGALMSMCQTTEQDRNELQQWLTVQIGKEGSLEKRYKQNGRSFDDLEDLVVLTRIQMLLAKSMASAEDCPFWIEPKKDFGGRQILDNRWFASVGGGGKGMSVTQGGDTDYNFGGAGRLLLGRGLGRHATLLTGVELGGSAAFPKDAMGDRGNLTLALDLVVPLIYRHRSVNTYWEVEAGYVAHTTEDQFEPAHGAHFGLAFGGSTSRRRWLFPGAAFGVSYERISESQTLHVLKLGFRVAIDIAP